MRSGDNIALLEAIHRVQARFVEEADAPEAFQDLLDHLLELTDSAYEEECEAIRRRMLSNQNHESLGALAGGLAHEFNNLLLGVMGNASLLKDRLSSAQDRELLDDILDASDKAADLCNQMLAYAGKGKFQIARVDLSEIVRGATHLVDSSAPKNVVLRYELADGLPAVEADRRQMRQMLINLLLNAVEAIDTRAGEIHVRTGVRRMSAEELAGMSLGALPPASGEGLMPGDYVVVEVADSGPGVPVEVRHKIFDPFFSTKFTGRGMGLAAVQGIVRSHGGALSFDSESGGGTIFRILLPTAEGASEAERSPAVRRPHREHRPVPAWEFPGKVLAVDDEEGVRAFLQRVLEEAGAPALFAADGIEALELYRRHRDEIDVVLLDLMMPRMDGVTTLRELRAVDPQIVTILTSGFGEEDVDERYPNHPEAEFLHKPYSADELVAKLREVLTAAGVPRFRPVAG